MDLRDRYDKISRNAQGETANKYSKALDNIKSRDAIAKLMK